MTHDPLDEVCVVVPVHNEAAAVAGVLHELRTVFPHVICVDDGSSDASAAVAHAAGAHVLRHAVNLGAGAAIQTGIRCALANPRYRHVVTFDADGQHSLDDAVHMWRTALKEDLDVVLGTRFAGVTTDMPAGRRAILRLATWYTRVTTGLEVTDTHVGLRVFSRRAAESLHIRLPGMAHASEILHHIARRQLSYTELPVHVRYTEYSLSKGQRNINAVNIVVDLMVSRLYALT